MEWSQLPENYFQGRPIGYDITYYPVHSEREINHSNTRFGMNTITLTNLSVYTLYVINVSAVSSGGIGPANTAVGRTDAEGISLTTFFCLYDIFINLRSSLPCRKE